ncbi:MAG: hypothetical protein ACE5OZ_17180 [Candidatus Heimdallarchaeota archaeon]
MLTKRIRMKLKILEKMQIQQFRALNHEITRGERHVIKKKFWQTVSDLILLAKCHKKIELMKERRVAPMLTREIIEELCASMLDAFHQQNGKESYDSSQVQ